MAPLKWSTSDAVWIDEVDDEHKEIFEAIAGFQKLLATGSLEEIRKSLERLMNAMAEHFAHEERLMHAARYYSFGWHKGLHAGALKKVRYFATGIEQGDTGAARAMVKYLKAWLRTHTRLADRMMGAFLRNEQRSVGKIVFRVGTKAADSCAWFDSAGNPFDPLTTPKRL